MNFKYLIASEIRKRLRHLFWPVAGRKVRPLPWTALAALHIASTYTHGGATPAVVHDALYLRGADSIYCIKQ